MYKESNNEWDRFLSGHWQAQMPQREGVFPVSPRDGGSRAVGSAHVVFCRDGVFTDSVGAAFKWEGWWWSEPLPELPKPPPWKEDVA